MADQFGIRVSGVRDLVRELRRAEQGELVKEMGRSNKAIGQLVIERLGPDPKTVGRGAGAKVRPSASARLVQLRAGGKHRAVDPDGRPHSSPRQMHVESWGRIWVGRRTRRPHIVGTARRVMPDIEERYMDGIARALSFFKRGR